MTRLIKTFAADERGATAIEYGLIAAGIAVAVLSSVNALGSKVSNTFAAVSSKMK
jgi:pilus assembly protein Flp/PilA